MWNWQRLSGDLVVINGDLMAYIQYYDIYICIYMYIYMYIYNVLRLSLMVI